MKVSVVIPTIEGRGELLARTIAALRETVPAGALELLTVRDRATCGEAWNDGAKLASGDLIFLAADDIEPQPGWLEAAVEAVDAGCYPSPHLTEFGRVLAAGSMGGGWLLEAAGDWCPVVSSQFPVMARAMWERIGPCLPIHYYADDYLSYRARAAGLHVVYRRGFHLDHLEGTIGRKRLIDRSAADRSLFLQALAEHEGRPGA